MAPSNTLSDAADMHRGHSVLVGKLGADATKGRARTDSGNVLLGQRSTMMLLSEWAEVISKGSMPNSIKVIGASSIPSKILELVVERVAVAMASLHSFWTWTDKGKQHQSVDSFEEGLVGHSHGDEIAHGFAIPCSHLLTQDSSGLRHKPSFPLAASHFPIERPDKAGIAGLVVRIAGYVFPSHLLTIA